MSTTTIQCDLNEDLVISEGSLVLLTGSDACVQNLRQRTRMRLGENQYNTSDGIDYFGAIFTPQPSYDAARISIEQNLLACPDTIAVDSLDIEISDNEFNFTANVRTQYGSSTVTGS